MYISYRITKSLILLSVFVSLCDPSSSSENELDTFKKLFTNKRILILNVVKDLASKKPEQRRAYLDATMKSLFKVLAECRDHFSGHESLLYDGENFVLPQNSRSKEYLALTLENACFFSDILLRFPDYASEVLRNKERDDLYRWSLTFVTTKLIDTALIDSSTRKLIHLASQELGVGEKDPNYVNPYKTEKPPVKRFEDPPPPKKKEKKKLRRGPRFNEL